jgi:A/G-specific adenine glycosylase
MNNFAIKVCFRVFMFFLESKNKCINRFREEVWNFYQKHGRSFAWRNIDDPYKIVVSEVMLQQTQTHRVIEKYREFIQLFPDFFSLTQASLKDVLQVWQGLGYNKRALFLQLIAQNVMSNHQGILPKDPLVLEKLPGIGPATAGSICAFAFNQPTIFIETNIRAVFIHYFFDKQQVVSDKEIFPLLAKTIDTVNPREWYYALMDCGVMIKKNYSNPNRSSKHYAKQSPFKGSDRQIRGIILKILIGVQQMSLQDIVTTINIEENSLQKIIDQMVKDGIIRKENNNVFI